MLDTFRDIIGERVLALPDIIKMFIVSMCAEAPYEDLFPFIAEEDLVTAAPLYVHVLDLVIVPHERD